MMISIDSLITSLRESDRYIATIFTEGGCYQFYLFIKSVFPDAIPLINEDKNHIIIQYQNEHYDINGRVDATGYCELNNEDRAMASEWSFSKNAFLSLGECQHCEEPILI